MLLLVNCAWAVPAESGGDLPLVHATAEERRYEQLTDLGDGRVQGRTRRKSGGSYVMWEIPGGTVVRYWKLGGGLPLEDHWMDAAGYPLATVTYQGTTAKNVTIPGSPPTEVSLQGWTKQSVPGGTMWLPTSTGSAGAGRVVGERPGGGVRMNALDGRVDVWLEQRIDPSSDTFRDGLIAGCGCFILDRASAWVDGRVGVRYRLLLPGASAGGVPGSTPRDATDLWAVELPQGTFLLTYTVFGPSDPVAALRNGRALIATVDLQPIAPKP